VSAYRRRTQFAAPLIVTLACGNSEPTETRNPPPPAPKFKGAWDVRRAPAGGCLAEDANPCAPDTKCNPPPPRAIECPPGTSGRTVIRVVELPAHTCGIAPAGCADPTCVKLATPCPLPHGQRFPQKLVEVWTVEKRGSECHAEEPNPDCPPNVDCNPPFPRKIECPPGVTETVALQVAQLADGSCAIVPDGCVAPACTTTKVACPK
jgi:hypothetical protein